MSVMIFQKMQESECEMCVFHLRERERACVHHFPFVCMYMYVCVCERVCVLLKKDGLEE